MGRNKVTEKHPRISIHWLKRFGLLKGNDCDPIGVQINNDQFLMYTEQDSALLSIIHSDGERTLVQKITIWNCNVKFGRKPFFLCPVTGDIVTELHFVNGYFASRNAFRNILSVKNGSPETRRQALARRKADRLLGRDGRGPARGNRRDRLVQELRQNCYAKWGDPELEDAIEAHDRRRRIAARSSFRGGSKREPAAMASVLNRASGLFDTEGFDTYRAHSATHWLSTAVPPDLPIEPRPLIELESCIALDIRVIAASFDLRQSTLWGAGLNWPHAGNFHVFALFIDLRDPDQACLAVREQGADDRKRSFQLIRLTQPYRTERWSMACPVTGKNCDLLYWRDGFFASEKAQRLVRRSQRSKRRRMKELGENAAT